MSLFTKIHALFFIIVMHTALYGSLSFEERRNIITELLQNYVLADDVNVDILARFTKRADTENIHEFLALVLHKAMQADQGNKLTMKNFNEVYYELSAGSVLHQFHPRLVAEKLIDDRSIAALHEAGHLVACAKHPKFIAWSGTIISRQYATGIYHELDRFESDGNWTNEDNKHDLICRLAGPVTEQVFNIPNQSLLGALWSKFVAYNQKRVDIELSFEELINRSSAQADLERVHEIIHNQLESYFSLQGIDYDWQDENFQEQYKQVGLELSENIYQDTVQFVQKHKSEIECLANILEAKGSVSTDEIYQACQMQRPKFDFEER